MVQTRQILQPKDSRAIFYYMQLPPDVPESFVKAAYADNIEKAIKELDPAMKSDRQALRETTPSPGKPSAVLTRRRSCLRFTTYDWLMGLSMWVFVELCDIQFFSTEHIKQFWYPLSWILYWPKQFNGLHSRLSYCDAISMLITYNYHCDLSRVFLPQRCTKYTKSCDSCAFSRLPSWIVLLRHLQCFPQIVNGYLDIAYRYKGRCVFLAVAMLLDLAAIFQ